MEEEEAEPPAALVLPSLPAQAQDTLRAPAEGHRLVRRVVQKSTARVAQPQRRPKQGLCGGKAGWGWQVLSLMPTQHLPLDPLLTTGTEPAAPTIHILAVKLHPGARGAAPDAFLPLVVAPLALAPPRQAGRQQEDAQQQGRDGFGDQGAAPHSCLSDCFELAALVVKEGEGGAPQKMLECLEGSGAQAAAPWHRAAAAWR